VGVALLKFILYSTEDDREMRGHVVAQSTQLLLAELFGMVLWYLYAHCGVVLLGELRCLSNVSNLVCMH
jgi:hypothetical protein